MPSWEFYILLGNLPGNFENQQPSNTVVSPTDSEGVRKLANL